MGSEILFGQRMSAADALLWDVERNPALRMTLLVVWILDRMPDRQALRDKLEQATRTIPRLRQRVVEGPFGVAPPRWEPDPNFDLDFHVRWLRSPGDGSLRALLELARPLAMETFDHHRPLWELSIVEGLEEERAAILLKLHHALSDGVGLVRMTGSLVERSREYEHQRTVFAPLPPAHVMTRTEHVLDSLRYEGHRLRSGVRDTLAMLRRTAPRALSRPATVAQELGATFGSVTRLLTPDGGPLSSLMRGRSLSCHLDVFTVSLPAMKSLAKESGVTLNDAFVAGLAGGLARYHERHESPVPALRMAMPVNLRPEADKGTTAGNAFIPVRLEIPLWIAAPRARMAAIRELVKEQRANPALGVFDQLSSLLHRLPSSLETAIFGAALRGVDFVCSNVPGPREAAYVSGARIEQTFGFGPLGGAAVNVTVFSYRDDLAVGVKSDPAAVPDPLTLGECLREGMDELLDRSPGQRQASPAVPTGGHRPVPAPAA